MPTAYSYLRYSSVGQSDGDSERRQIQKANEWASRNGYELDASHRDLGVSAFKGRHRARGALGRFLAKIKDGTIASGSALVVEAMDRLSREDPMDALRAFQEIIDHDVEVVTLHDGIRYTKQSLNQDSAQLYILIGQIQRANNESRLKSERIGEAMRDAKDAARRNKEPVAGRCPPWLEIVAENGRRHFRETPDANTVRLIYQLADEGMGGHAIAQHLNRTSVPTFRNAQGVASKWYAGYVLKLLRWRAVIGEWQPNRVTATGLVADGDPIADYYPAVVSPNQFLRVQSNKAKKAIPSGRKGTRVGNIFQGIMKCDTCGGAIHLSPGTSSRRRAYFYCIGKSLGTCSTKGMMNAAKVETAILSNITQWRFAKVFEHRPADDPLVAIERRLGEAILDQGRLDKQARNIGDMVAAAGAVPFLIERTRQVAAKIEETKKNIAQLEAERASLMHSETRRSRIEADIQSLIAQLGTNEDIARVRTQLATALREIVETIRLDTEKNVFDVILIGGVAAYRFERIGNQRQPYTVTNSFNLIKEVGKTIRPEAFIPHQWQGGAPVVVTGSEERLAALHRLKKASD